MHASHPPQKMTYISLSGSVFTMTKKRHCWVVLVEQGAGWGLWGGGFHSSWPQHNGSHCPQLGPSHHPLTGHKWKRGLLIKPAHSLSELLEASRAWGHVHGRPTFSMGHEAQLGFTHQGEQFKRRKPSRYNGHKPHTPTPNSS